jgi:hypothetical protein
MIRFGEPPWQYGKRQDAHIERLALISHSIRNPSLMFLETQ